MKVIFVYFIKLTIQQTWEGNQIYPIIHGGDYTSYFVNNNQYL